MWRNLLRITDRTLNIAPKLPYTNSHTKWSNHLLKAHGGIRSLVTTCLLRNTETVIANSEGDSEYIVPYRTEYEKANSAKTIIEVLNKRYSLKEKEVEQILCDEVVTRKFKTRSLLLTVDTLALAGVTKHSLAEYPWILTLSNKQLNDKIILLQSIGGLRDINDFIPFLRLPIQRLRKIVGVMNRESDNVVSGNRVNYIADKMGVPVRLVTKYVVKRLFVLELPLEMFKANLQYMLDYKVDPLSLLKDLWAFRYAPQAVQLRLERVKLAKKDKVMPWMVRCTEPILQKTLKLSLDELKVLGKNSTVAEYVGERLGFSVEEAQAIMNRHPHVKNVRATKIKEILDYLLDEEKFSRYDIANVPRILCHSLETTKQRLAELKEHGCRPSTLVIVCRSKREYQKFLNSWIENYNQNKNVSNVDEAEH